jgi:adenylate kinase
MQKRQLFILVGPPGSGKGTQADLLQKDLNINYYSVGEILRKEVIEKTELGKEVSPYLKTGKLVPDSVIAKIMLSKLKKSKKSLIFDGFPRNLNQTKLLDQELENVDIQKVMIEITLPSSKVFERILGRRYCVCGKTYHQEYNPPKKKGLCDRCGDKLKTRSDAKPEVINDRLEIYSKQTKPIIRFYKNHEGYVYRQVNGNKTIEVVHANLMKLLSEIK